MATAKELADQAAGPAITMATNISRRAIHHLQAMGKTDAAPLVLEGGVAPGNEALIARKSS